MRAETLSIGTPHSEREPLSGLRILFLLPFAARLDATHGGGRASAQLIAELALRHRVGLLCLRSADEPPIDPVLMERCEWIQEVNRPAIPGSFARRWLRHARLSVSLLLGRPVWIADYDASAYRQLVRKVTRSWRPDVVQIEYQVMAQYAPALEGCPAPRVLTVYEPGAALASAALHAQRGRARLLSYFDRLAWARFEPSALKQVQAVVALTEDDCALLSGLAPGTVVQRIPLGISLPEQPLSALGSTPPGLLFVGSFTHPPNVDAAWRLVSRIFPYVRERHPDVALYLVGAQPPQGLRKNAGERVIVTGCVPDVTPFLDRAALVVAPLRLGGGMRVKVMEALAAGKPVVASPLAVAGLDVSDGEHLVLAETDEQLGEAILRLLADPERRRQLASHARAWAEAQPAPRERAMAYERLYGRLVRGTKTREAPVPHLRAGGGRWR